MISIGAAQEISGIGYWELDFVKDELFWSNQVFKIFGVHPEDYTPSQTGFLGFVHPDDVEKLHAAFAKSIETNQPYELQHRIVQEGGAIVYVIEKCDTVIDEAGVPIKSFGSVQDVTKSVEYQMKLEASQRKFMAISNQTTEGITLADVAGNYVFVNPAFCEMSGYSESELLKMTVFDMKAKDQDHSSFNKSKQQMRGKPVRVNLQKRDGTEYFTEIFGDIINIEGESLVMGTIRDVSERMKSEELIHNLNKDLESKVKERTEQLNETIQRLSSEVEQRKQVEEQLKESLTVKEILLKEITHRVKNNMQIISSLINLQKSHLDEGASDVLEQISHRIHSMALIHETLYKTNEFKKIRFNHYLNLLINYIRESYTFENFDINLKAEEHQLPLDVGTSLGMIIIELVINSIKHAFGNMDEKGIIEIRFEEERMNNYRLTISDNGVGFPVDTDFRNTTSLGLDLVSSLVDQIFGEIQLLRKNGTVFEITFVSVSSENKE
ncbi:MAG: PAS domain S-box-containing protein [Cryomorphaceae bacterium]|jgi:PAS domain S-box-containing protein